MNNEQERTETQTEKNTRFWGYFLLSIVLLAVCVGMYALAGALASGATGIAIFIASIKAMTGTA